MAGKARISRHTIGAVLALTLTAACCVVAVEIPSQCDGVFDFSVAAVEKQAIDAAVENKMLEFHDLAPWANAHCKRAVRTVHCMLIATEKAAAVASKSYCRADCEAYLARCDEAADVLGDAFDPLVQQCKALPDESGGDCVEAEQVSSLVAPPPTCPKELVVPDSASKRDGATIHWADGSACAVPCPNDLVLTMDTWRMYSRVMLAMSAIGFVAGTITLACHIYKRLWAIVILTGSCTLLSLFLLVQAATNVDFELLCEGNAGFVEHGTFCMIVAGVMMFTTIWFCGWTLAIVLHLWLALVKRWNQDRLANLRTRCGMAVGIITAGLVAIPFATENVGFDWKGATGAMCYYMTTETPVYFWTVQWLPLVLITITGLALSIATVRHMLQETSGGRVNKANRVDTRALFWKYTGKQVVFAGLVLIATLLVLLITIDLEVETVKLKEDTDDYITCLLKQSSGGSGKKCDRPEDKVSWQLMVLICFSGLLGLFPFAAFGTAGVLQEMLEKQKPRDTENESKLSFENPMNRADDSRAGMQHFNIDENRPTTSDPAASELRKLCKIANQGVVPDRWTSVVVTRQFVL